MVELVDINNNNHERKKYSIKFLRKSTNLVIKEFLKCIDVPNIASITISLDDYISEYKNFTHEQFDNTIFTEVLSPLQQ